MRWWWGPLCARPTKFVEKNKKHEIHCITFLTDEYFVPMIVGFIVGGVVLGIIIVIVVIICVKRWYGKNYSMEPHELQRTFRG